MANTQFGLGGLTRLGILGGGQLGRMTALAAARLGIRCHVFAPETEAVAADVCEKHTRADYDDEAALKRFAASVDAVTLEFENVPISALAFLAEHVPVRPGARVLEVCQDRALEKATAQRFGCATVAWREVSDDSTAREAHRALGGDTVLKTARLGYDGKGQVRLRPNDDAASAYVALGGVPCVMEAFTPFERELSIIIARDAHGHSQCLPLVENRHRDHILYQTLAPAVVAPPIAAKARAMAQRLADGLDLVGVLAIELFACADGSLLLNEMAPRPHNSGHWSIDASACSQFEMLVRAVTGLPLVEPVLLARAEMTNLIGDDIALAAQALHEPHARVHVYGKSEVRPGRKMGHITRLQPIDVIQA